MYASFSRMLGLVSVKETDSHIIVNGIPGLRFSKDIYNAWKTSKITNNMFTSVSRSSVKFPKFYAIEVLYILEHLLESRRTFTGRRTLQRIAEELVRSTWLHNIGASQFKPRLNYKALDDLTVTLFPYQFNFLQNYDRTTFEYNLIGMLMDVAPGGGKTISNFALGHTLGADTRIYVVPKNSVHDVWIKTVKTVFRDKQEFWHSLSGEEPRPGIKHYIVHFDYLEKFLEFAKRNKNAFGHVFIALDESHNFNETSARTSFFIDLCQTTNARDVVHASGTPFKAMGSEAITLLKTVTNDFTAEVEQGFRKLFGKEAKKALNILANRIGIVSFKVLKDEVETPGVDYFETKVGLKNGGDYTLLAVRDKMSKFIEERLEYYRQGMKEYERLYETCMNLHGHTLGSNNAAKTAFAMYKSYIERIRKGYDPVTMKDMVMYCNRYELKTIVPSLPERYRKPFLNVRAIIKYVDLKVMGEALSQVLGKLRVQCHLDMLPFMPLDEIIDNAKSKTVIFTSYVEVVKELDSLLQQAGYKPLLVFGDTNKDLPDMTKKFEADQDANPMIATFKSLSTAVPLTMASSAVFTNSPFRDYERTQTVARIDRVGQKHRCSVYDMFLDTGTEPNISTRSKDILQWSRDQVAAILGVQTPDDLEASLEALVENPMASVKDGEKFMARLRDMLPADTIPQNETVSLEGIFGSDAPKVNIYSPRDVLIKLKETYLNMSWRTQQKFKLGKIELENGHLTTDKSVNETKRVLDKLVSEAKTRSNFLSKLANEFVNGGWKDPAKVKHWKAQITKDVRYGKYGEQEFDVIWKLNPLPGMVNYRIGGVSTVDLLGTDSAVLSTAKRLEVLLGHRAAIIDDLLDDLFSAKKFGVFHHGSDDDIELIDAIETSGLAHVSDALAVFKAIGNTVEKAESDFSNAPGMDTFAGHFEASYRALWALLTKSTK